MIRILSFGEIIWDVYPDGSRTLGGAPLNFAAHGAACGADAALWSAVGEDDMGCEALAILRCFGVDASRVITVREAPTGQCLVSLNDAGIPSYRITDHTAYDRIPMPREGEETGFDAIAFGTLALRHEHNRRALLSVLEKGNFSTIYCDLNLRPPFDGDAAVDICLAHAHILKVSKEEWDVLKRRFSLADDLACGALRLQQYAPHMKILLVTCGERGAYAWERDRGDVTHIPAYPAHVISTVGAGDSFGAAFLCGYLKGLSVLECLQLAARRSAFVVSYQEAVPVGAAGKDLL